ncbi:hypothetical protein EDB19DRAFT_1830851 [Suillus lakei]|nr:hypothetical protein EDB19DRAFT_1830851 [Suillus lakei]
MATAAPQDQDQIAYVQSVSSYSEKEKSAITTEITSVSGDSGGLEVHVQSINTDDPFPEVPDAPVEHQQLTVRAVLVGCILGGIIAASNIYLGLKTGWTFGASLFGSIIGFAILKPLSRSAPTFLGGGYFGPKENNVCQSAATKFYILKLKLVFPSGVAAAYTIQSLHVGKNAEVTARKKTKALIYAFTFAILLRVVSEYAPGMLWDWHVFYALNRIGWSSAIAAESWGWIWEWTPAFIGVGMLTGINASYSFLGGAFGTVANPSIPGYMSYMGMSLEDPIHLPSPRYWLIWPGTLMLLCASFTEVACDVVDDVVDPVPEHERVPFWAWGSLLVFSTIITCVVMGVQFGQNVGVTLLASLAVKALVGRTSIPVTSIGNYVKQSIRSQALTLLTGNASQLIFGGLGKGQNYAVKRGELLNLAFWNVDTGYTTCAFPAPDVQSWRAVAVAVSSSTLPIPPSSGYAAIALGLTAVISVVAKYTVVPPKYHDFIPNFNAIGIGFIMTNGRLAHFADVCTYPLAMFFGSTLAFFWRRMFFNNYQMYCFAVAAGFIAGEGLGGIVNAIFTISGISGATYGTSVGCPGSIYCG